MGIKYFIKASCEKIIIMGRNHTMYKHAYSHVNENTRKIVLSKSQKKEIVNYYSKYRKVSWKFHNFYTERTGNYAVNYIPDDIYFTKIGRYYNNYLLVRATDNKCDYSHMFLNILQPEVIAYRKGGYWFADGELISQEKMIEIMQAEGVGFIKVATATSGGAGVVYVDKKKDGDFEKIILNAIAKTSKDIIIQRPIVQHKDISKLNSSSVNTMRILSLLRNGEVKIYSSVLRIGGGQSKVDNFTAGGMAVGITSTGKLREYAYFLDGRKIACHPSSNVVFKDYQLPSFDEAQALVKKAHLCIPQFKIASWDVAIREDGKPILVEVNISDGEISFHQLNNGPLFGDDTREILDEVFGK